MSGRDLPPLALYVHLPWCVRRCPYCDFNSHALRAALPETRYVAALQSDLARQLPAVTGRALETVFFGGGTPSLFSPHSIDRVLSAVRSALVCAADLEVTLEANPGTIEHGRFADYRAAGVNRLSLGAQSFDAPALAALGRIHGPAEIRRAAAEARAAGFDNLNLDLMYGLPDQSASQALADLRAACELEPAHVSYYQLTLEPGTVFARHPPPLPDEDTCWRMHEQGLELLAAAGYERYEISAYARPGARCRHNLLVWRYGDYLGCGAGAHGKLTGRDGRIRRTARLRSPQLYMQAALGGGSLGEEWPVTEREAAFEYLLNVLRLPEGFSEAQLAVRTGAAPAALAKEFGSAQRRGLLCRAPAGAWRPTPRGLRFLNDLQLLFLPEPAAGPCSGGPAGS